MRRLALLTVLALALAACGSSAAPKHPKAGPIAFGVAGGNMVPYTITVSPSGSVRARGSFRTTHRQLSGSEVASLSSLVHARMAGLSSKQCPGTLPDIASQFVRAGGRTVRVHGGCEPAFNRLFNRLVRAVGLKSG